MSVSGVARTFSSSSRIRRHTTAVLAEEVDVRVDVHKADANRVELAVARATNHQWLLVFLVMARPIEPLPKQGS